MTDNQWTPEPWRPDEPASAKILSLDDVARACACVNACKGIPSERLEGLLLTRLYDILTETQQKYERYETRAIAIPWLGRVLKRGIPKWVIHYPPGRTLIDGVETDNGAIAKSMLEQVTA